MPALRRARYFTGKLLTAADLQAEQDYFREKLRRHHRRLHGAGVADGLQVSVTRGASPTTWCARVAPGFALDPAGNELEVDAPVELPIPPTARAFAVVLRYREELAGPTPVVGDAGTTGLEFSFVIETCDVVLVEDPPSPPRKGTPAARVGRINIPATAPELQLARFRRIRSGWRRAAGSRPRRVRLR